MTDKQKRVDESKEEAAKENTQKSEIYFSHNNFFAAFFDEKEVVESFLKEYVPAEIIKDLDFNTLQIDKESFVDKKLLRHFSDILYLIRYKQNPAYVYFLFEHKSRVKKKKKKLTPFQLLKYMVNIWDRHLKRHKKVDNLPPIIPMVIYHGEKEWEISTDFLSLFDIPQCMERYIPNFSFELFDISHNPDEYIKGTVLLRILFLTFKYIFNPELLHKLKDIFRLLMELEDKTRGTEYLEILLRYLSSSAEHVSVEEIRETVGEFFEQGGDIMPTIVQQVKNDTKEEIAKKMIEKGMDVDTILDVTGISRKKLEKIASTTSKTYSTQIN
ncbi:MAG: Rpn family recombination-promoting nuclease/putative transposase [Candidatus Aminicenantes bacterium]